MIDCDIAADLNDALTKCKNCVLTEDNSSFHGTLSNQESESCKSGSTSDNPDYSINHCELGRVCNSRLLPALIGASTDVYEKIVIKNSRKVHLGNVTVINGPIYVKKSNYKGEETQAEWTKINSTSQEERRYSDASIRHVDRRSWVSQPPTAYQLIENPAKFVVICHSATEDATTRPENILHVRYIQQFHIESQQWDDIAYNFLIGSDGYVYKGRGWGVVGAHTFRYNSVSVGICFIGTFNRKLPPHCALEQAKRLIRYGVEQGEIDPEYTLIGNCQASSSTSPGAALYNEIKTWPHFDETISLTNPSPLSDYFQN